MNLQPVSSALALFLASGLLPRTFAHEPFGEPAVSITTEGDFRVIRSNGLPDHKPGEFPNRGNPNSIAAQNYTFRVALYPRVAEQPTFGGGAFFGVAVNGVPFEAGTAEFWNGQRRWNYEAMSGFIDLGLDDHHAHVQPGGVYHYHGLPTGLIAKLGGDGSAMRLVGYAADGFPIYTSFAHENAKDAHSALRKLRSSYRLRTGERPGAPNGPGGKYTGEFTADFEYVPGSGDLDECNGRFGVTPENPEGVYYYSLTEEFPHVPRFWRGTPDNSFLKHGPRPGRGAGMGLGPGARGPRRGPPPAGFPPPVRPFPSGSDPFAPQP